MYCYVWSYWVYVDVPKNVCMRWSLHTCNTVTLSDSILLWICLLSNKSIPTFPGNWLTEDAFYLCRSEMPTTTLIGCWDKANLRCGTSVEAFWAPDIFGLWASNTSTLTFTFRKPRNLYMYKTHKWPKYFSQECYRSDIICYMNWMFCVEWLYIVFYCQFMFYVHSCSCLVSRLSHMWMRAEQGGARGWGYSCSIF